MLQNADVGKIRDRGLAMAGDALLVFTPRLRHMDVERPSQLSVCGGKFTAESRIRKVFRMDAHIRNNSSMGSSVPLAREVHAIVKPPFHEVQPHAADVRLEPSIRESLPSRIREVVHIGNAGRAACKHFHHTPCDTCFDVHRRHFRLHREYGLLKPTLQRQSATKTTDKSHSRMSMRVHKPRHDQRTAKIFRLGDLDALWLLSDCGNHAVLDKKVPCLNRMVGQKHPAIR